MVQALRRTTPQDPMDILVIGGGATGTGIALDAATRYSLRLVYRCPGVCAQSSGIEMR